MQGRAWPLLAVGISLAFHWHFIVIVGYHLSGILVEWEDMPAGTAQLAYCLPSVFPVRII